MANRIPLVVVSTEQLIKELPAVDDLDLANSSIRNVSSLVGNSSLTLSTSAGSGGNIIIAANNTEDIRITPDGNVGIGTATPNARLHIVGTTIIEEILEKANISATAMGANANVDILECAVVYYTANSTANTTLNIRGNSTVTLNSIMSTNQSMSMAFIITNGASAFRVGNVQIDGANTTVKWSGGSAPTACSNATEAYAFTLIKTGAAAQYTLLGSKTQFA